MHTYVVFSLFYRRFVSFFLRCFVPAITISCCTLCLLGCAVHAESFSASASGLQALRLAQVDLAAHWHDRAAYQLNRASALLSSEDPRLLTLRAYQEELLGHRILAERMHKRLLRRYPKRTDLLNNYGVFLCHIGRKKEALRCFQRACQDPQGLRCHRVLQNQQRCRLLSSV